MDSPTDRRAAPTLEWLGDCHLRIGLGDAISPDCQGRVRAAFAALHDAGIPALDDLTPAYSTILLGFDPSTLDPGAAESAVRAALARAGGAAPPTARMVELPVCYDASLAPDLADVAARCSLTSAEVVALHCGAEYTVAFIGFAPGFPYLSGLPARLNVPRLDGPRPRIPAGSVAIAGDQAGVYPHATPGGWRILGRTPIKLFDPAASPPSLLAIGDRVRFRPITLDQFHTDSPAR